MKSDRARTTGRAGEGLSSLAKRGRRADRNGFRSTHTAEQECFSDSTLKRCVSCKRPARTTSDEQRKMGRLGFPFRCANLTSRRLRRPTRLENYRRDLRNTAMAGSGKREAGSGKREAGSGKRLRNNQGRLEIQVRSSRSASARCFSPCSPLLASSSRSLLPAPPLTARSSESPRACPAAPGSGCS